MQNKHKRKINGVLLLDKPIGISSNQALQQAKRLFHAEKAGHTGVLDPLASGLLPICLGEATKFAQYLLDADKAYTATLKLGEATTTGDAEGEIIDVSDHRVEQADFQAVCAGLTGDIRQIPPMFSALKHQGKPLYEYARKGIVIERKPRDITIYNIDLIEFNFPSAVIDVRCSKGTYIRTLVEDIARKINSYAHLTALRRIATAGFGIEQTHTLAQLSMLTEMQRDAVLLPCDALVQHLPRVDLDEATAQKLRLGQTAPFSGSLKSNVPMRAYDLAGQFIGLVAYFSHHDCLKVVRLMNTAN